MYRGRRLRRSVGLRRMVREHHLHKEDLMLPIFVVEGEGVYKEIETLPDVYHYSIDQLYRILDEMTHLQITSCMLFGIPSHKDAYGSEAYASEGIIQRAIRYIKQHYPHIVVVCDVCMCEYTNHGHCGILNDKQEVDNDVTLTYIAKIALSYCEAGVDMVAPSDMMDGHIHAIRTVLDEHGFQHIPIMGYSAKYASSFYGPFRAAANSTPCFGDRKGYQMDRANGNEAMREIDADIQEGVDIIMVKPALAYLDIVTQAKQKYSLPLAVYNVSGEYAMLKLAVKEGLLHEDAIIEIMLSMKRAGADIIITYFACYVAKAIEEGRI